MAYGTITVNDTATLIIPANPDRQSHLIMNVEGVQSIYIGPDNGVTTANGFRLGPGNQLLEDKSHAGYWQGDIYGIANAAQSADIRYWTRVHKS
jgi:hypothetical protein